MRRRHAISPGFSGHYQDLGISSLKRHDSACNIILSVVMPRCGSHVSPSGGPLASGTGSCQSSVSVGTWQCHACSKSGLVKNKVTQPMPYLIQVCVYSSTGDGRMRGHLVAEVAWQRPHITMREPSLAKKS